MAKTLFSIISFLNLFAFAAEANPYTVTDQKTLYDLSTSIEWFIDENARFKVNDITEGLLESRFNEPPEKMLNLGHTDQPVWCRFEIKNLIPENLYLNLLNPDFDSVSVYVFDNKNNLVYFHQTGDYVPNDKREINGNSFFIDLHMDKGRQYTVYLRARAMSSSVFFPLFIAPLKVFFNNHPGYNWFQAMYYGIIFFIIIYNLFLFIILKKSEHFYFAAFVFFLGLSFAVYRGYANQYLWGSQTWLNQYVTVFSALSGISAILFTSTLLRSSEKAPLRHIWFLALIGIFIITILIHLAGFPFISYHFLLYNAFFTFVFIISISLSAWLTGYKPAGYYILAWSFFIIGLIIYTLRDSGILPFNSFTAQANQIGSTLAIILISFTLGKKINIYIDNTNEAWSLAVRTAEENERLIKHQNQLLEERVNQRTRDLEQTVHTLQQQEEALKVANQFKDKVFSMISHDLKSPLSTLGGLLNVLQKENLTSSEKSRILKNLRLSLNNTHDILDNIFEWATRRRFRDKHFKEFDLHQVVEEMISLFYLQLESKSLTFSNRVKPQTYIKTDKNMIQLVLRNLISNAIKFTTEGGKITVSMDASENDFDIRVSDTGVGMSFEDQEKLFNSTNHFTTRGTNNEKGTGLGLLLCKEFVEKNDGTIEVSSIKGEGTTFSVKLKKVSGKKEEITV